MATKDLTQPPSLTTLFTKAAVTGPLHRGDSLPDSVYTLAEQAIDVDHLAAYQRVCEFRVTDVLPPTYLHILAFPLSVALMTERAFPFPLVGAVHVNNTITVTRPVLSSETVSLTVRAADLRPHPAGRQFDLLTDAVVGAETVWSGRSTYLRRGKPAEGSAEKKDRKPTEATAVTRIAAAAHIRVPENIGRRYGAVSGDRNPIHLHSLTAKAFGFPSNIAHGMWLKARTLASLEGRLPDSFTVDVAFKLPVLLPSTISMSSEQTDDGYTLDVRNSKSGKPHMSGTVSRL